jgi:hypothetical protein
MAEIPDRDLSLLLDMLIASRDAVEFKRGLSKEAFLSSRSTLASRLSEGLAVEPSPPLRQRTNARPRSGSA